MRRKYGNYGEYGEEYGEYGEEYGNYGEELWGDGEDKVKNTAKINTANIETNV